MNRQFKTYLSLHSMMLCANRAAQFSQQVLISLQMACGLMQCPGGTKRWKRLSPLISTPPGWGMIHSIHSWQLPSLRKLYPRLQERYPKGCSECVNQKCLPYTLQETGVEDDFLGQDSESTGNKSNN